MALVNPTLEARLMFRPFSSYALLASGTTGGILRMLRRPLQFALVLGCFVSMTCTGRLSARMVADGLACWSFIPLMNLVLVGALAWRFSRRELALSVDGYLAASGPWLVWLVGVAGVAVWLPPRGTEVWSMMPSPVALAGLAVAWWWSAWIQYRCLTVVWRLPPVGAVVLLAGMKAIVWGAIALFFLASDQLEPRMGSLLGG